MRDVAARPPGRSAPRLRLNFVLVTFLSALALSACGRSSLRTIGENSSSTVGGSGGNAGHGGTGGNATGGHGGSAAVDGGAGGTAGQAPPDGGPQDRPDTSPDGRRPFGLGLSPALITLASGGTAQLSATLFYIDGNNADVTLTATWASSDPLVAVVSAGRVTGLRPGKTIITVTTNGFTTQSTVIVNGMVTLVGLAIDPPIATLPINGGTLFRATAQFSDGTTADVTPAATWSSSSPSVAGVSAGFVAARTPGTTTLVATYNGVAAKAVVVVTAASVVQVTIQPPFQSAGVGTKVSFTADALLSDGTHADVTSVATWSTDNPGVATIGGGIATGVSGGGVVVTATFGGFSGFAKLSISPATLVALQIDPIDPEVGIGGTLSFTLVGILSDGTRVALTSQAMWSSSAPDVLVFDIGSHAVAKSGGTAVVTAAVGGFTVTSTVTVTPASLLSINITPATSTIGPGGAVPLRATGTLSNGSIIDVTSQVRWDVSPVGVVAVSNAAGTQGLATGLAAGTATVIATLGSAQGKAVITVSPATLTRIDVSPAMSILPIQAAENLSATGTFSDGTKRDVTFEVTWASTDTSIATVANGPLATPGIVTGVKEGAVKITASENGITGIAVVSVVPATIKSIIVSPVDATTTTGLRSSYTAIGVFSDGSKLDVTSQATWTTVDATIATISNVAGAVGQLTARAPGKTTVSATFNGVAGQTIVAVEDAAPSSLSISPISPATALGSGVSFTATLVFSNGTQRNVTGQATWTSSNGMVATINRMGRATSVGTGTTTISAAYMGLTASSTLTVTNPVPTSLQVSPIAPTMSVGGSAPFTATVILSDGTTRNVTNMATWVSDDPGVAGVTTARMRGVVTAVGTGSATITATYMGLSGQTMLAVNDATVVSISVSPVAAILPVNTRRQFTATAIRSDGTSFAVTGQSTWESNDQSVAQVATAGGARGQVTAIGAGTTQILATYMGLSGSAPVTVTAATLSSIQVTPFAETVPIGQPVPFVATAIFTDGTNTVVTGVSTWQSTDGSVALVSNAGGSRGVATTLAKGTTTISATYMGMLGSTTLAVTDATIVQIQVTPFQPTLPAGFDLRFTATAIYSDGSNSNLTALATWTSSIPATADVSNSFATKGLVSAFTPGDAAIKAQYAGVEGSADVKVTSAQLSAIVVTPSTATLSPMGVQAYVATGTFDDLSQLDVTTFVTWTSSDMGVADVSNADGSRGQATAFAPGTTTIQAQRATITGTATLTVQ